MKVINAASMGRRIEAMPTLIMRGEFGDSVVDDLERSIPLFDDLLEGLVDTSSFTPTQYVTSLRHHVNGMIGVADEHIAVADYEARVIQTLHDFFVPQRGVRSMDAPSQVETGLFARLDVLASSAQR